MAKIPVYNNKNTINKSYINVKNVSTIKTNNGNVLVELSDHNANVIKAAIANSNDYLNFGEIVYEYLKTTSQYFTSSDWLKILRAIDFDNSTNVWRYSNSNTNKVSGKTSMLAIADYMVKTGYNKIKSHDLTAVKDIINAGRGGNGMGKNYHSFASKVCKYVDEYSNLSTENYNNHFFIDDSVIKRMLPYYIDAYCPNQKSIVIGGVPHKLTKSTSAIQESITYVELYNCLEDIYNNAKIKPVAKNLTRSDLDMIIWYSYK